MTDESIEEPTKLEVRSYFVRGRNALMARADFGSLFIDYYLHLAEHGLQYEPQHDNLLKEALAALTLHCAARPWKEHVAWSINFQEPRCNVFVAGDNDQFGITGQIFTENVRIDKTGLFYADTISGRGEKRRSVVESDWSNPFQAVERYYAQSEQRLARYFEYGPEDYVLISAQPDCDLAWLESLTDEAVRGLDETETLSLLEQRVYHWHCGCNQTRMRNFLSAAMRSDPVGLFGEDPSLRMQCPRCGARYQITRTAMEAHIKLA
jgi:molecular chaperone Hsp33